MAQIAFPYTTFQDAYGDPLGSGYVLIRLNQDAQSPTGQLCAGLDVRVQLNSNGVMESIPQVWPNTSLSPPGTYYIYSAFTAEGQLVLGPDSVVI